MLNLTRRRKDDDDGDDDDEEEDNDDDACVAATIFDGRLTRSRRRGSPVVDAGTGTGKEAWDIGFGVVARAAATAAAASLGVCAMGR